MSETWHILGVGSIGGLFAHRLHQGGAKIRLLSQSPYPPRRTIKLKTSNIETEVRFDSSALDDSECITHLLITVKSWAAGAALRQIQHRINENTTIVAMMNGMQHLDDIRQVAPECALFLASTTAGCYRTKDQWVAAGDGKTLIGHPHNAEPPAWLSSWKQGVPSLNWCTNINERLVEKVAINACINPLTAVNQVKNGALLTSPLNAQTETVTAEVALILTELGYSQMALSLGDTVRTVITDTAENTSSMYGDVMAGRKTEVESILGWLLDQSDSQHPVLESLLSELQSIEPTF